ncbi:MAG: Hint domain-containing protein [Shimia sp.]
MSWAVIFDAGRATHSRGLPSHLAQGSILIEVQVAAGDLPRTILKDEWSIEIRADQCVDIEGPMGGAFVGETLTLALDDVAQPLRLSIAWAPAGGVLFTAFQPWSGHLSQAHVGTSGLVEAAPLQDALSQANASLAALSTAWEPIGPMPTWRTVGALLTARGPVAMENLAPGDTIGCQITGAAEVLAVPEATLPACGSFRPIRLKAPWFGLRRDVLVSAEALVVVGGDDLEYLCGTPQALVRAEQLVNGTSAVWERTGPVMRYHQPVCVHVIAPVGTLSMPTLDLSMVMGTPIGRASSHLAGVHKPPQEGGLPLPRLRDYEALTLIEMRAA